MPNTRKIFIGSSSEALNMAQHVADVIKKAELGMEPVIWTQNVFKPGMTLLETIESIPFDYHAAALVWSPDVFCRRGKKRGFSAPVANVVFEYGYLAARLTRKRVAICKFGNVEIPSDLQGVKSIQFSGFDSQDASPSPLDDDPGNNTLVEWLDQLPVLAAGLPSVSQVHGYSGTWRVQNSFTRWRGLPVKKEDKIYFDGKTTLFLDTDGKAGSGTQVGHLYIIVADYTATYAIVNEVLRANVDDEGSLTLNIRVIRRRCIEEYGDPPSDRYRAGLPNTEFKVTLRRKSEERMTLEGEHEYKQAGEPFQIAHETYEYLGLFNPPGL
jgi:hypothetical protein